MLGIAGSRGFIGGALAKELPEAKMGSSHDWDFTDYLDCLTFCDDLETLYICAGVTGGAGAIKRDPMSFVTPNLLIHINLFKAAKQCGVKKVVCLSSTTGYPNKDKTFFEAEYFSGEVHPAYYNPGETRRFIEKLGTMTGLPIVFLRPSVVYGPGDNFDLETSHVIPATVRKIAERQDPLTIWGDGTEERDGVYIDDMVRALVLSKDAEHGAYNIAAGESMSINAMVRHLCDYTGFHPRVIHDYDRPSMIKRRNLAIVKAKYSLGWEPKIMMREGLEKTYTHYEHCRLSA